MISYNLRYEVEAETRLEAIDKASRLLRSNVKLRGVVQVEEFLVGWWTVILSVDEDV